MVIPRDYWEPSRRAIAPAVRAGGHENDVRVPCFGAGNRSSHPIASPSEEEAKAMLPLHSATDAECRRTMEEAKASLPLRSAADAKYRPTMDGRIASQRKPIDRPAGRARN